MVRSREQELEYLIEDHESKRGDDMMNEIDQHAIGQCAKELSTLRDEFEVMENKYDVDVSWTRELEWQGQPRT